VLASEGGALAKMLTPFELGLGAALGSGAQWMPWIHVDDAVGLLRFAAATNTLRGPLNAAAPESVTTAEFTKALGRVVHRPASLRAERLPATREDVERAWAWAKSACLPNFGPFEDAMSSRSTNLFHTGIAPLLNLQRLSAHRVVSDVLAMDLPLPSKEGFVRQGSRHRG